MKKTVIHFSVGWITFVETYSGDIARFLHTFLGSGLQLCQVFFPVNLAMDQPPGMVFTFHIEHPCKNVGNHQFSPNPEILALF